MIDVADLGTIWTKVNSWQTPISKDHVEVFSEAGGLCGLTHAASLSQDTSKLIILRRERQSVTNIVHRLKLEPKVVGHGELGRLNGRGRLNRVKSILTSRDVD